MLAAVRLKRGPTIRRQAARRLPATAVYCVNAYLVMIRGRHRTARDERQCIDTFRTIKSCPGEVEAGALVDHAVPERTRSRSWAARGGHDMEPQVGGAARDARVGYRGRRHGPDGRPR